MSGERFEVVVHHDGTLIKEVPFKYIDGEIVVWDVDLDKWSFFEIVGALKDLGYLQVKELYYSVQYLLHKLYDDRGAMNMMKVANFLGKIDLYVVHGVDEVEVVEDDVNQIYLLCEAEAPGWSGEGTRVIGSPHIERGDEGNMEEVEVQNEVEERAVASDEVGEVHIEGGVQVDVDGGLELESTGGQEVDAGVEVDEDGGVELEINAGQEVDGGVQEEDFMDRGEDGVDNEVEVEVHNEDGVDSEVEVEVNNEDEGHMDHLSGDEYVEEAKEVGIALEDSDEEYRAEPHARGLLEDEWHSDVLLTPQNSGTGSTTEAYTGEDTDSLWNDLADVPKAVSKVALFPSSFDGRARALHPQTQIPSSKNPAENTVANFPVRSPSLPSTTTVRRHALKNHKEPLKNRSTSHEPVAKL
ncbi:hypothetical protein LR48_Vigan10g069700 [Vigna angularis]|uniref:PB1-like domain-containing protein n=1 Tax=Phaseolus angularis TaxID=3914 RepID=A0A0L9VIB1_PHAAN|nr:hypothetical protein LR48_Vigan10g069700 [Vigna angularis]